MKKRNREHLARLIIGCLLIAFYKILELIPGAEEQLYLDTVKPLHNFLARVCDHFSFSVAEVLIGLTAILIVVDIIRIVVDIIRDKKIINGLGALALLIFSNIAIIYGGFCILWGVYYSASDVEKICGISSDGVLHDDLIATDMYFLKLANEYSDKVGRDAEGCVVFSKESVFDNAPYVYSNAVKVFPGLSAKEHRPKAVHFSEIMSMMDFTGFFFPFTAEANINVHSPDSMIPVTIAHELAHQRGIAAEDEANFIAVFACLEYGDPDYVYSASLLALVHLQNALYKSGDMDAWQEIRDMYSEGVEKDLVQNSEYWKKYRDTTVYKTANNTYDAFLKSYNQTMGTETYGACVDLLVEYYH